MSKPLPKVTITLNDVEYAPVTRQSDRVIIRASAAGVHVGTLVSKEGDTVVLSKANRLHYFKSATPRKALYSLSEVATQGVCRKESRIGAELETITIRDWCEIIPVTAGVDLTACNND